MLVRLQFEDERNESGAGQLCSLQSLGESEQGHPGTMPVNEEYSFSTILNAHWNLEEYDLNKIEGIGVGLMGFGVFFLLFGIILYFDRVLLGFGNILFISGLPFIAGLQNTFRFFYQRQKLKGSSFFLGGILLVLLRWPGVGMLCESYGFYLLFKSTLPLVSEFITTIPVLRFIFTFPGFSMARSACGDTHSGLRTLESEAKHNLLE